MSFRIYLMNPNSLFLFFCFHRSSQKQYLYHIFSMYTSGMAIAHKYTPMCVAPLRVSLQSGPTTLQTQCRAEPSLSALPTDGRLALYVLIRFCKRQHIAMRFSNFIAFKYNLVRSNTIQYDLVESDTFQYVSRKLNMSSYYNNLMQIGIMVWKVQFVLQNINLYLYVIFILVVCIGNSGNHHLHKQQWNQYRRLRSKSFERMLTFIDSTTKYRNLLQNFVPKQEIK